MRSKAVKRVISIIALAAFLSTNTAYAVPSSRSLFRNKKVDHKKLSTERENALQKKRTMLKGEGAAKKESHKKELKLALSQHLEDLSLIHIPSELGRVIEVYENQGEGDRLLVLIQDLHTNPEAQFNLAKMLELLIKDYGMNLICSEGAEKEIDASKISRFPDSEIREKVAKIFVNSGELTGEEYLAITKYPDLPIWGIEDKDIYTEPGGIQ